MRTVGKWYTRFKYIMKPRGIWVPVAGPTKDMKKKQIEKSASEYGRHVFETKKWAEAESVSFEIS